jgi:hypothetical protein
VRHLNIFIKKDLLVTLWRKQLNFLHVNSLQY